MNPLHSNRFVSRRGFLGVSLGTAGVAAAAALSSQRPGGAATQAGASNPFVYDVERLRKTDPKWIHYEQVKRIPVPREGALRIAMGPEDQLHVAAGSYVTVLDRDGARSREVALPSPARSLAVARDGTLYAGLRDHVAVFDAKGQRRETWEVPPGRKACFTGIAVGESDVFVADAGNRIVYRYDRSGKLLQRIGQRDKDRSIPGFVVPSPFFDLELHRDGLLRVANPGRHQVEAYTFDGDLELSWGRPSMGIEGFCGCCNPINLALLPNGRIVTCEKGLPRVKVYTVEGQLESVVAGPEAFAENAKACGPDDCSSGGLDAAVDSTGRVHVLDLVTNNVRVLARKAEAPAPPRT
jgi:hypothetical protein